MRGACPSAALAGGMVAGVRTRGLLRGREREEVGRGRELGSGQRGDGSLGMRACQTCCCLNSTGCLRDLSLCRSLSLSVFDVLFHALSHSLSLAPCLCLSLSLALSNSLLLSAISLFPPSLFFFGPENSLYMRSVSGCKPFSAIQQPIAERDSLR